MNKLLLTAAVFAASVFPVCGQGTLEDYNRAFGLARKYNYGRVPNARINPRWIGSTDRFWYVADLPDGAKEYMVADVVKKTRLPLRR